MLSSKITKRGVEAFLQPSRRQTSWFDAPTPPDGGQIAGDLVFSVREPDYDSVVGQGGNEVPSAG